jgi:hypothetical protein
LNTVVESSPKKRSKKTILIVVAATTVLCILCLGVAISQSQSPEFKATQTAKTALAELNEKDSYSKAEVVQATKLAYTPASTATITSTVTPAETATSLPPQMQTGTVVAATKQAKMAAATALAEAAQATAAERAKYKEIDWRELKSYAKNHTGEYVIIRGPIFNIIDDMTFQMHFSGTSEAAFVSMEEAFTGIYEDTSVTVYGVIEGTKCGENGFGAEICQPWITGQFFEK